MNRYTRISRNGIYRSRSGMILGVCKGLAQHFDFSVFWTRVIALILLFVAGFFPAIGLYLLAALLMKPAPVIPVRGPRARPRCTRMRRAREAPRPACGGRPPRGPV